ncbi:uncharacterized protein [Epargyreus clarus]|uniref:uncharacterized protein n=1 Tax=Epargyreus clarus TaxID=520877 RepID=UPI003C2F7382
MKSPVRLGQSIIVLCSAILITAEQGYENRLTKLWSATGVNSGSAINVTSDSIVIPSSYRGQYTSTRQSKDMKIPSDFKQYVFRPRAIPLRISDQPDRNVYYSQDANSKYKSEILFPGNYFTIAKEKSNENLTKDSAYNPSNAEPFKPKTIPLMRGQEFQKRSLDVEEEPSIEVPEQFSKQTASRRSLSYVLGVDEDEDNDEEEGEFEEEDEGEEQAEGTLKSKIKHRIKKAKKYSKYMMPLLLAYKLKYFALVPVMIAGLVLLIGATGMAGFFFALFAAVMGLQKGGY